MKRLLASALAFIALAATAQDMECRKDCNQKFATCLKYAANDVQKKDCSEEQVKCLGACRR